MPKPIEICKNDKSFPECVRSNLRSDSWKNTRFYVNGTKPVYFNSTRTSAKTVLTFARLREIDGRSI